jgi:signal transduction histidine kinase
VGALVDELTAEVAALRQSIDRQIALQEEANSIMRGMVEALKTVARELAIPEANVRLFS